MVNMTPGSQADAGFEAAPAACMSLGGGAFVPSAEATRLVGKESCTIFVRPRTSWDACISGQLLTVANPSMTGLGDPGNRAALAGPQDAYALRNPGKQYPHTTRIAAASGDAQGPHPARDPV